MLQRPKLIRRASVLLIIVTFSFAACTLSLYSFLQSRTEHVSSLTNSNDGVDATTGMSPRSTDHDPVQVKTDHLLCLLVPFRNRYKELQQFVPHMDKFLSSKQIHYETHVLNQVDNLRFNRASLINVGFLLTQSRCDYMAMHDVDLLPNHPGLFYGYPSQGPFHVAAPHLHPKYHYKKFIGGILLFTKEQYLMVNGMSNRYWGWGREDDEFYGRLHDAKLQVIRHGENDIIPVADAFLHVHDAVEQPRDYRRTKEQKESEFLRDYYTGLQDVHYHINSSYAKTIGGVGYVFHNVYLFCNRTQTPWCTIG